MGDHRIPATLDYQKLFHQDVGTCLPPGPLYYQDHLPLRVKNLCGYYCGSVIRACKFSCSAFYYHI